MVLPAAPTPLVDDRATEIKRPLLDKIVSSVTSSLSCYGKIDKVSPSKMDALPKAFVSSLRVLFEILDEDSDGYVELAEIEKRWQGNSVTGLPAGVVDSLRGIAPKDGRLSFERFCTGLKITLEKNRSLSKGRQVQVRGSRNSKDEKQPTTATVRPNNVVHPMRTKSAPQLQDIPTKPIRQMGNLRSSTSALPDDKKTIDPPDYAAHMQKTKDKLRKHSDKSDDLYSKHRIDVSDHTLADKKRVEATIKSWQQEKRQSSSQFQRQPDVIYGRKQDVSVYAKPPQSFLGDTSKPPVESNYEKPVRRTSESTQKAGGRRKKDEPRRHTLSNGIDYNMTPLSDKLKRMKQLEQERDTFLQGLEALELARDWYRQQLASIRDRQDRINKAQIDFTEDIDYQEMVVYRTTRITELNRQLRALIATPEKGFPNHMNLAINRYGKSTGSQGDIGAPLLVDKLKHQNKQLTEEVSSKSDRISKLEQEKAALIRQLFEARGRNRDLPDNTTFL